MPFTITPIPSENTDIIHLAAGGQATALDFPAENACYFDTILGPDWKTKLVLLNLEQLSYLDSAAIGWLLTSQKSFRAAGGFLVLHSVTPPIRNILEMLKIGRIVPITPDAAAGSALLLQHAPTVPA